MKITSLLHTTSRGLSFILTLFCGELLEDNRLSSISIRRERPLLACNETIISLHRPTHFSVESGESSLKDKQKNLSKDRRSSPPADGFGSRQRYLKSCVPASAAMAGTLATSKPITERQMCDAIKPGHDWNQRGISVTKAAVALQSIGVTAHIISHDQIISALAHGPVIVVVPTGKNTTHAVVCTGRDALGILSIWNPDPPIGYNCHMKMTAGSILKDFPAVSVPKLRGKNTNDIELTANGLLF